MTTLILAHQKISSSLSLSAFRVERARAISFFENQMLTGIAAAFLILGAILYMGMLLMSFGFGVRLRDISLSVGRMDTEIERMEVLDREREASFAARHKIVLEGMQEIVTLKYLTPENASLSEAHSGAPLH